MKLNELEYTTLLRSNPDLAGPRLPRMKRGQGKAPEEHEEQAAVLAWADEHAGRWPELGLLFHVPNGGYRDKATAAILRQAGVKAGVPDLFLPAARRGVDGRQMHGLWIEMKKRDHSSSPSAEQRTWIEALRRQGYMVVVCYGFDEAIRCLEHYLSQGESEK